MPWMLETLKSCTGKKEVTSSSYASGLYIYVIKSLKGRSIISMKVYYLNNMQGSLDRGSIPEVSIGTLGCAFEYRQGTQPDCGTQRLASWLFFRELHDMLVNLINFGLFPLRIIVNKQLNKPLQAMAPTLMPSNIWNAGLLFRRISHTRTHVHLDFLASVGAKNKFAITSMSSSQVHKMVKELKWTLRENPRWGPRCMRWLRRGATSRISYHFGPKEKEISWMAQKCQIF